MYPFSTVLKVKPWVSATQLVCWLISQSMMVQHIYYLIYTVRGQFVWVLNPDPFHTWKLRLQIVPSEIWLSELTSGASRWGRNRHEPPLNFDWLCFFNQVCFRMFQIKVKSMREHNKTIELPERSIRNLIHLHLSIWFLLLVSTFHTLVVARSDKLRQALRSSRTTFC